MSKTHPPNDHDTDQESHKSPLTAVVEAMEAQINDPLRNDVVKTRSLANKIERSSSRKVARILSRLADGYVDGVEIESWNGKRSDENKLYKIINIDTIPEYSLFITNDMCGQYRRELLGSDIRLQDIADATPHSKSVIRSHIIGKCNHDHTHPKITYDRKNEVWVEANTP